ncbi:hypothetical protein [Vulcanisaeta distributa]|uniref:hypothetical protein n=1 Tax=Vulcanisaeta distributa TaxID=164451 RepID=UPI0006D04B68|nr:hypothetical protein [Vulcanisaeta distributa]
MASSDDVLAQIKDYVDKRLTEFRDELLDYLDSVKARDLERVKKEVIKLLVGEVEELKKQLLSEVESRGDIGDVVRRIDELGREISELRRLISSQSNQQSIVDIVRREVEGVENRLRWFIIDKINEAETKRRRNSARRAVLTLLGIAVGIAVVIALAFELAPWLIPLIIIIVAVLLRR